MEEGRAGNSAYCSMPQEVNRGYTVVDCRGFLPVLRAGARACAGRLDVVRTQMRLAAESPIVTVPAGVCTCRVSS